MKNQSSLKDYPVPLRTLNSSITYSYLISLQSSSCLSDREEEDLYDYAFNYNGRVEQQHLRQQQQQQQQAPFLDSSSYAMPIQSPGAGSNSSHGQKQKMAG